MMAHKKIVPLSLGLIAAVAGLVAGLVFVPDWGSGDTSGDSPVDVTASTDIELIDAPDAVATIPNDTPIAPPVDVVATTPNDTPIAPPADVVATTPDEPPDPGQGGGDLPPEMVLLRDALPLHPSKVDTEPLGGVSTSPDYLSTGSN